MSKLETVYKYFVKRLETEAVLTLADIKKTDDFKKLTKDEQKQLEKMLNKKIEHLKNKKIEKKLDKSKKPKKKLQKSKK